MTILVLRYYDNGTSTVGLMYVDGEFSCYTLEDRFRFEKVPGETRIPSGTYPITVRKEDTPLTIKYRRVYRFFDYHLEIDQVPNFDNVYIHVGNTHDDTEGCLLVGDMVISQKTNKIAHSVNAFERVYKRIRAALDQGESVVITLTDIEHFIHKAHA